MGGEAMMRAGVAAGLVVLAAVLAGCSGPLDAVHPTADAGLGTATPLAAESDAPFTYDSDRDFLQYVRDSFPADTVIPDATDEQLLAAGAEVCERMAAGEDTLTMSVIEGEEPNEAGALDDSAMIVTGALTYLCL